MNDENRSSLATVQYTFRIPVKLKQALEIIAEAEDRSLSRQIISVLRRFVDENSKAA